MTDQPEAPMSGEEKEAWDYARSRTPEGALEGYEPDEPEAPEFCEHGISMERICERCGDEAEASTGVEHSVDDVRVLLPIMRRHPDWSPLPDVTRKLAELCLTFAEENERLRNAGGTALLNLSCYGEDSSDGANEIYLTEARKALEVFDREVSDG